MQAATIAAGWDWATSVLTAIPAVGRGASCTVARVTAIFWRPCATKWHRRMEEFPLVISGDQRALGAKLWRTLSMVSSMPLKGVMRGR